MASATTALNLEQFRKSSGVSLESIAETTKISSRFLRAIECEEFEKLPGGVFDTSYIRQYASAIGFSEQRLLDEYSCRMQPPEETQPVSAEARPRSRRIIQWLLSLAPVQRF